ncbi:MAG: CPBP family intramembrane glutamic endopeptidase [Chloroflexota bacterium]
MTIGGVEFDLKLTILIIFGTIVPMLDYYGHKLTSTKAYDRFILYFVLSMLIILLVFRESPTDYGFKLGNWKVGLAWTVGVCVVMAVILWFVARTPAMQAYYEARTPENVRRLLWLNGVELFGWEFVWRGFMLFGLAQILGPGPAILIQAVPFAFMHLGKPEVETLSTIFGGIGFGFIAWQSDSFVYPWLIHWFIASFTMLIAVGRF